MERVLRGTGLACAAISTKDRSNYMPLLYFGGNRQRGLANAGLQASMSVVKAVNLGDEARKRGG